MNCASCGQALEPGEPRCPFCGTAVPKRGDLVLDLTPPPSRPSDNASETPRSPVTPRRQERQWREEVRDRVHERRRDRGYESDLPLFAPRHEAPRPSPPPVARPPVARSETPADDLPLRPAEQEPSLAVPTHRRVEVSDEPDAAEEEPATSGAWLLGSDSEGQELSAAERPASGMERAQAAALDVALLATVWAVILGFSAKATRAGLGGLQPSWPVVAGYLAFFGLIYAAYFTGVAGRTPGKMMLGLRVVDTYGHAPGFFRALFRAVFGTLGALAVGIGLLPMIFDPARRALHDRLFGTRVIRV